MERDYEIENAKEWAGAPDWPSNQAKAAAAAKDGRGQPKAALSRQRETTTMMISGETPFLIEFGDNALKSYVQESNRFALNRDNSAKDAWRRRHQPDGNFRLPYGMAQLYSRIYSTVRRGTQSHTVNPLQAVFEQIGQQSGAFIEIPGKSTVRDVLIWGELEQVRAAQQELAAWLQRNRGARQEWAKNHNYTEKRKKALDEKMEQLAKKQSYRRNPAENEFFQHGVSLSSFCGGSSASVMDMADLINLSKGIFIWPKVGFPAASLLGLNLEAFDPIRMEHGCYITFDAEKSWIKVLSHQWGSVTTALDRIRFTLYEMIARSRYPTKIYMIEPAQPHALGREVTLIPLQQFFQKDALQGEDGLKSMMPHMTGPFPTPEERGTWEILQPDIGDTNHMCIKRTTSIILKSMRYYRAHIRMRVSFGFLRLRTYKKPANSNYTLEEFWLMMKNPRSGGEIFRGVEQEEGARLLSRCHQAVDVLDPFDAVTQSLEDVTPVFSVSFELGIINKGGSVRLDLTFVRAENGGFDIASIRWLRMTRGHSRNTPTDMKKESMPLTLVTMDLFRDTAWELKISCRDIIPDLRLTSAMRYFAEKVRLEVKDPVGQPRNSIPTPSVTYPQNEIRVKSYIINVHYRYLLRQSTYVLEITKAARYSRAEDMKMPMVGTKWKASMYNLEWDTMLEQQAILDIGQAGQWDAKLENFFPPQFPDKNAESTDGVKQFVDKVRLVSRLLDQKKH